MKVTEAAIRHSLIKPLVAVVVVVVIGGFGYYFLEPMSLLDAFYMAVITITTVGFKEVTPLDDGGKVFTIVLLLLGVGAVTYFATSVANYIVAGELRGFWERRRMQKNIDKTSDHYIVCGYGRMGVEVTSEFRRSDVPVVVVEREPNAVQRAIDGGVPVLAGDSESDDLLISAGIKRARGLVAVLDSDADNLMVTLSSRALNEKLFIVTRIKAATSESKMLAAGADRVIFPHGLGGRRMAQMALRPNVVEFLELVMHDEELELWMEEMKIAIDAPLAGRAIGAANIRGATGANILAVRQRTGKLVVGPAPDTQLEAGDILVALGTRKQVETLRVMTV